jgi:hypothetical protein
MGKSFNSGYLTNIIGYSGSNVAITGSVNVSGSMNILSNLVVTGSITAQQYIVSSSVTYLTESFASGSHKFGDSLDDTHQFTGSVYITSSLSIGTTGTPAPFVVSNKGLAGLEFDPSGSTLGGPSISSYNRGASARYDLEFAGREMQFYTGNPSLSIGLKIATNGNIRLNSLTELRTDLSNIGLSINTSGSNPQLTITNTTNGVGQTAGIYFGQMTTTGVDARPGGSIKSIAVGTYTGGSGGTYTSDMVFLTNNGTGDVERLRLLSNGQIKSIPNVGNYSQVFSIAGNAPNANVDDIVLGFNVISGNPYTITRGNTSNSAWQIFSRTAHSPAADGNSTFGIDYVSLSGTQLGVMRVTGDSASPAVQFPTVGYHEVGSAGFSNTPNYGGQLVVVTRIPQGTWTTFANVTNNSWAGITELNWASVADYNRSGAAYLRWAYNGSTTAGLDVVYTLYNNSQNATATFRNNSGALQINISGGAADYYVQARILGSRAA